MRKQDLQPTNGLGTSNHMILPLDWHHPTTIHLGSLLRQLLLSSAMLWLIFSLLFHSTSIHLHHIFTL